MLHSELLAVPCSAVCARFPKSGLPSSGLFLNPLQRSPHAKLHDKLLKRTAKEGFILSLLVQRGFRS